MYPHTRFTIHVLDLRKDTMRFFGLITNVCDTDEYMKSQRAMQDIQEDMTSPDAAGVHVFLVLTPYRMT